MFVLFDMGFVPILSRRTSAVRLGPWPQLRMKHLATAGSNDTICMQAKVFPFNRLLYTGLGPKPTSSLELLLIGCAVALK